MGDHRSRCAAGSGPFVATKILGCMTILILAEHALPLARLFQHECGLPIQNTELCCTPLNLGNSNSSAPTLGSRLAQRCPVNSLSRRTAHGPLRINSMRHTCRYPEKV